MKTFVRLFVILAVLAAAGAFLAYRALNAFSADAIERSVTFIFNTETTIDNARLAAQDSRLELHGFKLGSPKGYDAGESFAFAEGSAVLDANTITTGRPGIKSLILLEPVITIEFEGKTSNYAKLIENAKRFTANDTGDPAEIPVYFEKIIVEEPRVRFIAPVIDTPIETRIPTFELENVGTADEPITSSQAAIRFARAILVATASEAAGELPDPLAAALRFESLAAQAAQTGTKLKDAIEDRLGDVGERINQFTDTMKERALERLSPPEEEP